MRPGPLLVTAAASCAATHAAGVLFAEPVWRYAEVACVSLLFGYAVVGGVPAPRWSLPAALVTFLADALRTVPAAPGATGYAWLVRSPDAGVDVRSGFASALLVCWAPLTAAVLLLVAHGRPPRRAVATVVEA